MVTVLLAVPLPSRLDSERGRGKKAIGEVRASPEPTFLSPVCSDLYLQLRGWKGVRRKREKMKNAIWAHFSSKQNQGFIGKEKKSRFYF